MEKCKRTYRKSMFYFHLENDNKVKEDSDILSKTTNSEDSEPNAEENQDQNFKKPRKESGYTMFRREEMGKLKTQVPKISGRELLRQVGHNWSKIKDTPEAKIYFDRADEENKKMIPQNNNRIGKRRKTSEEINLSKFF